MAVDENTIQELFAEVIAECTPPASVYRLQLNKNFPFDAAAAIVPYLHELGIGDLYASPCFEASPGSPHGYDVTNPNRLNPELGGEEAHASLCAALQAHGMSQLLDIVPNHMGVEGNNNPLWNDVLENGPASVYSEYFDIDWSPAKPEMRNKLLVPILGDRFGCELEEGRIHLRFENGAFHIEYGPHRLPLAPKTYPLILESGLERLRGDPDTDPRALNELLSIITALHNLPNRNESRPVKIDERYREKQIARERLAALVDASPRIALYLEETLRLLNGEPGHPESYDRLEALLDAQAWRLASWRVAAEEINYRRFFDINRLAAIRVENDEVFRFCHRLAFALLLDGRVRGLRIDHTDGLYHPPRYLRQLQEQYLLEKCLQKLRERGSEPAGPLAERIRRAAEACDFQAGLPLFVVVEKILDRKESLPADWAVHGTVGYEFLNALNGLFIDGSGEQEINETYAAFTGMRPDYEEMLYLKKKFFAGVHMPGEINTLGSLLEKIAKRNRMYRDFTLFSLIHAIRELIACFPVYRTYITPDAERVSERDEKYITIAVEKARHRNLETSHLVFDFIRDILLLRLDERGDTEEKQACREFILRFQQITSPIMAKGMEDTVFYINNRFLALNEVGNDPAYFSWSPGEFHRQNIDRLRNWPCALTTVSTHDTKRSHDVRMRLDVLSEIPAEWKLRINRWTRLNKKHKTVLEGRSQPDRNTEYMIYQSLLGIWPDYPMEPAALETFGERFREYVRKAVREAKTVTSWVNPHEAYETAVDTFLRAVLSPKKSNHFMKAFRPFQERISGFGKLNTLAALVLQLGSPGVVDCYQGNELWNYTLVDPDNRRPVDFAIRGHLLGRVRELLAAPGPFADKAAELLREKRDSRIKLFVLREGLHFRHRCRELLLHGSYLGLRARGAREDCLVAFKRRLGNATAIVATGRFFTRLVEDPDTAPVGSAVWQDTEILLPADLQAGPWYEVFSGETIRIGEKDGQPVIAAAAVFCHFPFAILVNNDPREAQADGT